MAEPRRVRDERGTTTLLIIGVAFVLLIAIAVVIDASAAYLQRQGLDTVADGAALAGADAGAAGEEIYAEGVASTRLELIEAEARVGVAGYLARSGAAERFPGLSYDVAVGDRSVVVVVRAPLDLPLTVPGSPGRTVVSARASAVVAPDR